MQDTKPATPDSKAPTDPLVVAGTPLDLPAAWATKPHGTYDGLGITVPAVSPTTGVASRRFSDGR